MIRPDLTFVLSATSCAESTEPLRWMTNSILVFNQMWEKIRLDIAFLDGKLVISVKDVKQAGKSVQNG